MARLVALSEGFAGQSVELTADKTTIGRVEDNDFQIVHPSVSSHHCEILKKGSEIVVRDLNSTNGSFIDGQQISEASLSPSQSLRLGQIDFKLETAEAPAASAPAAKTPEPAPAPAPAPSAPTTPPTSTKKFDKSKTASRGIKPEELEKATRSFDPQTSTFFQKKSNKANKIFIGIGIGLGVVILGLLIFAVIKLSAGGS